MAKNVAVILASGVGQRSGLGRPKQLVKLAGRPVIAHALASFQQHAAVDEIAIVTNSVCLGEIEALVSSECMTKVKRVLLGGRERYDSSLAAIRAYSTEPDADGLNLIFHDAVRPLVSDRIISDVIDALQHYDAIDVAIPSPDTVLFADPDTNTISNIPDRHLVRLGQTPQAFKLRTIQAAYDLALRDPDFRTTDDCGVVLRYLPDTPIYIVDGSPSNVKLTYHDDLMIIDKLMQTNAARRLDAVPETVLLSRLRGKSLAIIGGTSGIGAAMARMATAYGAQVAVGGRSTGLDIASGESITRFLESAANSVGELDAIVNSAAVLNRQPLAHMTSAEILDDISINLIGCMLIARMSYQYLAPTRGHLMFFTSSSYTYGRALYSTYSASKAAVVNLTQALADEWFDAGIHVNCVNPERTQTPMRTKAFGNEPANTLLSADDVARKALGVLVTNTTGYIYDVVRQETSGASRSPAERTADRRCLPAFFPGPAS